MQRRGTKYAKFFSDRVLGSPERALVAARIWRDELIKEVSRQEHARTCQTSARNSSGVVGVSRIRVVAANGITYEFWQATWSPEPGKRKCVKFSIKRYGDREAFRLAVQARTEGIGE